jgi:hypothetical protein
VAVTDYALVKEQLNLKTDTQQTFIESIIAGVQASFEKEIGYPLDLDSRSYRMDGKGNRVLFVKHPPISAVTLLQIGTQTVQAATGPDEAGYLFDQKRIILTASATPPVFSKGFLNILIEHDSGYDDDDMPADLRRAATIQSALEYLRHTDERAGKTSMALGPTQSTSYIVSEFDPQVAETLRRHKMVSY